MDTGSSVSLLSQTTFEKLWPERELSPCKYRLQSYSEEPITVKDFPGIRRSQCRGNTFVRCVICSSDFTISHGGRHDAVTHVNGKRHKEMVKAASSSRTNNDTF